MRAGRLRERLVIEHYTNADVDRAGHIDPLKWKTFATVWGRVERVGSNETQRTEQLQTSMTHTVTIRYCDGVDTEMRVCWLDGTKQRTLGIGGVTADERRTEMTLSCRENG